MSAHPFRRGLQRMFPEALRRTCGFPSCAQVLTVDLFDPEPRFKAAAYCSIEHQDAANRRRKKLWLALDRVSRLLDEDSAMDAENDDAAERLTRAELLKWQRRLAWELDGYPDLQWRTAKRQRRSGREPQPNP